MDRMTRRDTLKLAGLSLPMAAAVGAQPSRNKPYLILSCDGGGIRGLLTAKVIERLQNEVPFLDKVDLFAGTSTGGIIALGLAHNLSPAELVALYRDRGPEIFTVNSSRHPARSRFLEFLSGLDAKVRELLRSFQFDPLDLIHPRYSNAGLRRVLTQHFGKATMGDLRRSAVVTTLRLFSEARNWAPLVLHNVGEANADAADIRVQDKQTLSTKLVDAALCTMPPPSISRLTRTPSSASALTAASSPTAPRASRWASPAVPIRGMSIASASSRSARAYKSAGSTSHIQRPSTGRPNTGPWHGSLPFLAG